MEQLLRRRSKSTSPPQRCTEEKTKKKGFLTRAVERCRSLGRRRVVPEGCFAVVVGPERERFAVRAERANHPLFRVLLEEAEAEYGFPRPAAEPQLVLPCGVETFRRVMAEVEREEEEKERVECGGAAGLMAPRSPAVRFFLTGGARAGYQKMSPKRAGAALLE